MLRKLALAAAFILIPVGAMAGPPAYNYDAYDDGDNCPGGGPAGYVEQATYGYGYGYRPYYGYGGYGGYYRPRYYGYGGYYQPRRYYGGYGGGYRGYGYRGGYGRY